MSDYYSDLRKMLRTVRLACGLSQKLVAATLGISRSTYTYYESGRTSPDIPTLKALAAVFGLPPECFLYPEEFCGLESARLRAPKRAGGEPLSLGSLQEEEKALVLQYRIKNAGLPLR